MTYSHHCFLYPLFSAACHSAELRLQPDPQCADKHSALTDIRQDAGIRPALPAPRLGEVCGQHTQSD